jgi:hypothetical protein
VVFAVLGAANVVCDLAAEVAEIAALLVAEIAGSPALQQIGKHFGTATNRHTLWHCNKSTYTLTLQQIGIHFGTATRLHALWNCNKTA